MKRSNAPIFWLLFGAGGMLAALIGAMLVYVTGIAGPLGLGLPADLLSYDHARAFAGHAAGGLALFVVIALFLWHAAHRIFHSLHDLGVHAGRGAKWLCYGGAGAATIVAALAIARLGMA